ncbi:MULTISPECIES: hypothetical protein [unclassified Bradyrhizobium]|uniref:hypothetical protein n=1 Tax=unclassified Bradyrhizobium TaxID=2631580 RepID=UPI001FF9A8FA|nr:MULTISPECIES: hypothetical protein [unclassified Bradyrhizobium]MCK1267126.1 hypothetical protein [Bradyrhizobium sp. 84]MCK1290993.1 hypothetical protein [Bradyrhizobium sp. 30]MCK1374930.1 hypothetical protein [Bradyrhizobium sp. 49]MCK1508711.1 hypothetical protein [Bradyrhizobium sp. 18]MCK1672069.1 hypothetical protein [Bradyrhizobium sp. 150]
MINIALTKDAMSWRDYLLFSAQIATIVSMAAALVLTSISVSNHLKNRPPSVPVIQSIERAM